MRVLLMAMAAVAMSVAAHADDVKVKLDRAETPAAAEYNLAKLERAAKRACKAAPAIYGYFSRADLRACMDETMSRTLAMIDSPALFAAASVKNAAYAKAPSKSAVAASE
jgi:hypothetical protein